MTSKIASAVTGLLFLAIALAVVAAQQYQPDDPVPRDAVFTILDLDSQILDLIERVEDATNIVPAGRRGITSGPHSTISSDFLYLPAEEVATLTIRVADGLGQPVAGKRVQVAASSSAGPVDTVMQPEAPTDARGIATARVKAGAPAHTARFSGVVLPDNIEIGQIVEIEVQNAGPPSLFPPAFAPYFAENYFVVSPTPLMIGRPTTITVPLTNRRQVAIEARVRFLSNVPNIGLGKWPQIGETETLVVKPGETRDATITWTPAAESGHLCFKAEVWGRELLQPTTAGAWRRWPPFVVTAFAETPARPSTSATPALMDARQQNVGPVEPRTTRCKISTAYPDPFSLAVQRHDNESHFEWVQRNGVYSRQQAKVLQGRAEDLLARHATDQAADALEQSRIYIMFGECAEDQMALANKDKSLCAGTAGQRRQQLDDLQAQIETQLALARSGKPEYDASLLGQLVEMMHSTSDEFNGFKRCADDPPDPRYQQLASAASDTPAGHIDAFTVSMERYQAARSDNNREWMRRHFTAMRLYLKRYAEASRRAGDALRQKGEKLAPEDPRTLAGLQEARGRLIERLRRKDALSKEDLTRLTHAGLDESAAREAHDRLLKVNELPPAKQLRTVLLQIAAAYRESAGVADQHAALPASTGEEGGTGEARSFTYVVGNPQSREENIDLFIRRANVPTGWTLSIEDAEPQSDGKPRKLVQEIEAGRHYRVQLPASGRTTVASVVVPIGIVAENTTVRWAVEGKIGDELIGGMVHEMYVPGLIPDLKLPPITPASDAGPTMAGESTSARSRWLTLVSIAATVAIALAVAFAARARRRAKKT